MTAGWDYDYSLHRDDYETLFATSMIQKQNVSVKFLEDDIKEIVGREHAIVCGSGTDALMLSLLSWGINPGDRVLVSNFSWIATASVISMIGATPVFCDIDLDSYHMNIDSIKRMYKLHSGDAIIYPQLFGNVTVPTAILEFCAANDIIFIEDSCQGLGASENGIMAGTLGDISVFSFNHNKNVAGIAGGGVILTDDQYTADSLRLLRSQGHGKLVGYNSEMLHLNATIIQYRLTHLKEYQEKRREIAKIYDAALDQLPIWTQWDQADNHSYHKYVIRFDNPDDREAIKKKLSASVHYDKSIADNEMYNSIQYCSDSCQNAKKAAKTVLTLPLNPFTSLDNTNHVIQTICKHFLEE